MHEWQEGDLGVAKEVEDISIFEPGTVVRYEGYASPGIGFWRIVFGPVPTERRSWIRGDGGDGLWLEYVDYVDPLPEGE